jgi:AcrR family transcriptional regulator
MQRRKSLATRERLLEAATDMFMDKGYRDATVAEICARARTNVAAVSYHFGSKEALYREAWRTAFEASIAAHPLDGGVAPDAPAGHRFRGHVRAMIERIGDPRSRDFLITHLELINPTGLLSEVMESAFEPMRAHLRGLVREMLGPAADDALVRHCEIAITSMCIHPMVMLRTGERPGRPETPAFVKDIPAFAEHVMTFAQAGLAAVRSQLA